VQPEETKRAQKTIVLGVSTITLIVTPWTTQDPINVGKFFLLLVMSAGILAIMLPQIRGTLRKSRTLGLLFAAYLLDLLVVFLFAPGWKIQQLFGTEGRNTGFLTYIAFASLLYCSAHLVDIYLLNLFRVGIYTTGVLSLVYGFIQYAGTDPAPWVNPDNPIIGFLGNSNFQSSFIGICICFLIPNLVSQPQSLPIFAIKASFVILGIAQIFLSGSIQGIFVIGAGVGTLVLIKTYTSKYKSKTIYLAGISAITIGIVAAGLMNKGPLAKILFTKTVMARYEYWQAGIKMAFRHPVFGVGLDSFGDWYRRSRTVGAMLRRDVMTDSAHNIFIDHFANGGIILGIIFIAIHFLVLRSIFRIVKRGSINLITLGLICAWVGFFSQEFISISQIGLAVWGWLISGLVIGLDLNQSPLAGLDKSKKEKVLSASASLRFFIGLFVGLILGIMPLISDAKFYSALKSSSEVKLSEAAGTFGATAKTQLRIITIFQDNGLFAKSLLLADSLVQKDSEVYEAWALIYSNPNSSKDRKAVAMRNMQRLEPNRIFN